MVSGEAWSALAKFLHRLVAALIAAQLVLGWLATQWRLSPTKLDLFVWHKSTGMLVLTRDAAHRMSRQFGGRHTVPYLLAHFVA